MRTIKAWLESYFEAKHSWVNLTTGESTTKRRVAKTWLKQGYGVNYYENYCLMSTTWGNNSRADLKELMFTVFSDSERANFCSDVLSQAR